MNASTAIITKKYNLLLSTEVSQMTAGAAYSFRELAIWMEKNSEYHVVALLKQKGDLYRSLKNEGIESYVIPQRKKWLKYLDEQNGGAKRILKESIRSVLIPTEILMLKRLFKKIRIDIVHVNGLTSGMCAEVAINNDIPVIWHIREFLEEDLNVAFENRNAAIATINKSKCIIAVSEAVRQKYIKILKPNIEVVYNGFNIDAISHKNKGTKDILRICLVGRLIRGKGQLDLVRALGLLSSADRDRCEVHFIGYEKDKQYLREIKDEIGRNNIGSYVFFDGYIPNAYEILSEFRCVCVCSAMEAFGRTTIEGMLNNCLIIGADTGGTSELVQDNVTGILYEYGNINSLSEKISFCINNPDEVDRLAENGFRYAVDKFGIDITCKKIVDIYDRYSGQK